MVCLERYWTESGKIEPQEFSFRRASKDAYFCLLSSSFLPAIQILEESAHSTSDSPPPPLLCRLPIEFKWRNWSRWKMWLNGLFPLPRFFFFLKKWLDSHSQVNLFYIFQHLYVSDIVTEMYSRICIYTSKPACVLHIGALGIQWSRADELSVTLAPLMEVHTWCSSPV